MRLPCSSLRLALASCLVAFAAAAHAQGPLPAGCQEVDAPPSLWLVCVPSNWNGHLIVFAHGYVAPDDAAGPRGYYSQLLLADGTSIPDLVQSLGFAFASSSFPRNGLAILEGTADLQQLVDSFWAGVGGAQPRGRTYVAGASEGGLVAALLAERRPDMFAGALAACGPIGSFQFQLNYIGDFRVLFDYFFGGRIPNWPKWRPGQPEVPQFLIDTWPAYEVAIVNALAARPDLALQLMRTSRAPWDPADAATIAQTTLGLLWYHVFGTNDSVTQLGGIAFDNTPRWYSGSASDLLLNLRVARFDAPAAVRETVRAYDASGLLRIPFVTLHTTKDEIAPYAHELLYAVKARPTGRGAFLPLPVFRYGHCNFTAAEVLTGLGLLLIQP